MIIRHHSKDGTTSSAVFSDCEKFRYALTRVWDETAPRVLFVMLNPSTADETQNDPTVERCEQRSRRLGYGAFRVTNIFAYRATDPRNMRAAPDPVGPENDTVLAEGAAWADHIVASWGVHGEHQDRGPKVAYILVQTGVPLFHLGLSKAGHPRHPLYLPYAQQPVSWSPLATP